MSLERILCVHTYYQEPGGEDRVFAAETSLLEQHGHTVLRYTLHNDAIKEMSRPDLARAAIWNRQTQADLAALMTRERPDLVHFHNTFVLVSPAAYYTVQQAGVPVVQTLHNYRLVCPNALLLRNQQICDDCLGKTLPWPGVLHACYHESRPQTAVIAATLAFHRVRGTWHQQVDRFIALSEFSRRQFIAGGLPAERIAVKPNFLHPDPGAKTAPGDYALYTGRLSPEKGIQTMLAAWAHSLDQQGIRLKVAGDGPLMAAAQQTVQRHGLQNVELLGRQPHSVVLELLKQARLLVFPSECYENFSVSLVEAFACGVPVVASRLGSMAEIVSHGQTGVLFAPGDPVDLARQVAQVWQQPATLDRLGHTARATFETRYTAEQNYRRLHEIYTQAAASHPV